MSMFMNLSSICGATSSAVDVFDLDLNPHGVICCANCRLIIEARESWAKEYDYAF
jgi:hypothetical protein